MLHWCFSCRNVNGLLFRIVVLLCLNMCVYSGTAKLEDAADLFVRAANSFKVAKRNKGGFW